VVHCVVFKWGKWSRRHQAERVAKKERESLDAVSRRVLIVWLRCNVWAVGKEKRDQKEGSGLSYGGTFYGVADLG